MSFEKIQGLKASLNEKQLEILNSKTLIGSFDPVKLLKTLSKLAYFDKINDTVRAELGKNARKMGLIIAVTIIGSIVLSLSLEHVIPAIVGGVILIVTITVLVISLTQQSKLKKDDLEDGFRTFIVPLVGLFREEIKPGTKLKLEFHAGEAISKKYFKEKIPRAQSLGREYLNYEFPWLGGSITFFDDTNLIFACTKFIQKINVRKKGASGKIKFKTKYKYKETSLLKIVFSKNNYTANGTAQDGLMVSQSDDAIIVKAKYNAKSAESTEMPVNQFLGMVHRMYSIVTPKGN